MKDFSKINLGCGDVKWKDFCNIDIDASLKPDLVHDIRYEKLPFENDSIEEVWMCHTLEHIEKRHWPSIFFEVNRVLGPDNLFYLTYPEFEKCFEFWKNNERGKKDFWEACLYGRQASPSDYHVSICHTPDLKYELRQYGFGEFLASPETNQPQYSALSMVKKHNTYTKEDMLRETVFRS